LNYFTLREQQMFHAACADCGRKTSFKQTFKQMAYYCCSGTYYIAMLL